MNTARYQLVQRILEFTTIISIIYCIGCSNMSDDTVANDDIVEDMPIEEVEVLLAESDPVQVTVEVTGWLLNGCIEHHETHQAQEGNTITIQITTILMEYGGCTAAVTEYQEQIFIGALPAGDYKVIVNDVERNFRID